MMIEKITDMWKIPLFKNSKRPVLEKWQKPEQHTKTIPYYYDTAIITGKRNNLIVFDVDIKDDGMDDYLKYIKINGDLQTLKIQTKSGGFHFYFKYNHTNKGTEYLINEFLSTNRVKLRDKGLDIRSNCGCVKAIPSYGYSIINDIEISEIPELLILWLMEDVIKNKISKKPKENVIIHQNKINNYKYNISLLEFENILNMLDNNYFTEYYKWLSVLTVAKNLNNNGLDTYTIFDNFSKKDKDKYDEENNLLIWNNNFGNIDINYLINVINKDKNKINLIERFKLYENDIIINNKYQKITINKKYLDYTQKIFNDNETIIIKSTTGTGKTTSTAKYLKKYLKKNTNTKILSLVNLIKLSEQQIKTFKDEGIELLSYQTATPIQIHDGNIVCCLNSIHNKINIRDDQFKNYVVYIDEITSFIESFLYNDSLNNHLKSTYLMLMKIIKNCKKLVISDAMLNNNVFNLLEQRKTNKNIIISNEYKKYDDVNGIRYNSEDTFFNKIAEQVKNDKYFLFGLDSKSTVNKYYNELINIFPQKKDKFLIITSDQILKLTNTVEQFENKFVFFSPSITTGIDFSIDNKQDVFIYIKGNTINPASSFQQATRTRNIDTLHYYSCCKDNKINYTSCDEVNNIFKTKIETNEKLLSISGIIDENDELKIINNTFLKLFCEGIYKQDCEQTNKLLHFEEILKNEGFKLKQIGEKREFNKETKKAMTKKMKEIETEKINNYINETNLYNKEIEKIDNGDIDNINDKIFLNNVNEKDIYKKMIDRKKFLKLEDNQLEDYKFLLNDEFNYNSYFNFLKAFKTNKVISEQLINNKQNNMNVKLLNSTNNKIILLRKFEKDNNIAPFDINFEKNDDINVNLNDDKFKHVQDIFRISKSKPTDKNGLKKLYIGMLKNIFGTLEIIKSKRFKTKERKEIITYTFNNDLIDKLFKLAFKSNKSCFDDQLLTTINIKKPIDKIEKSNVDYNF